MVQVNLLPWREVRRLQIKKAKNKLISIILIITISLIIILNQLTGYLIKKQSMLNHRLKQEVYLFDKTIREVNLLKEKKKKLLLNIKTLHALEANKSFTLHLLEELVNLMPDGVYLIKIQRQGNKVVLLGYAQSTKHISLLMHRLERCSLVVKSQLKEVKKNMGTERLYGNQFELNIRLLSESAKEAQE